MGFEVLRLESLLHDSGAGNPPTPEPEIAEMARQDTIDFLTAFAVGTVIGVGATLLLQPDQSPKARIARELKPYRKQLRKGYEKGYKNVSRSLREGTESASEMASDAIGAGRELIREFRSEVADIIDQARDELGEMISDQSKDLMKTARRTRRKIGL
jgi:gas vesicle protein